MKKTPLRSRARETQKEEDEKIERRRMCVGGGAHDEAHERLEEAPLTEEGGDRGEGGGDSKEADLEGKRGRDKQ